MNQTDAVSLIALVGWLVLVGGALASYRLNWNKALRMGLTWIAVFVAVFLLFDAVIGS